MKSRLSAGLSARLCSDVDCARIRQKSGPFKPLPTFEI
jgi:hypothetical protein